MPTSPVLATLTPDDRSLLIGGAVLLGILIASSVLGWALRRNRR